MIRLELASSREFPRGSAGRTYLIRLPLTDDGAVDTAALQSQPGRATVRRYWPNEADMVGHLVHTPQGYAVRYDGESNGRGQQRLLQFGADSIAVGEQIVLAEPDGRELGFRVAALN